MRSDVPAPEHSAPEVGVLSKVTLILAALEGGALNLGGLVACTGLARPTVHRIATALAHHRLVARDPLGRFVLGPRLAELAVTAARNQLRITPQPVLSRLHEISGASVRLWRRQDQQRICVATVADPANDAVLGTRATMNAGSAAHVLLAWQHPERYEQWLTTAKFPATVLAMARRRGWSQSVGERVPQCASVSAPVWSPCHRVVVAAVSVSGPVEQLSRQPGFRYAPAVMSAAHHLSQLISDQSRDAG